MGKVAHLQKDPHLTERRGAKGGHSESVATESRIWGVLPDRGWMDGPIYRAAHNWPVKGCRDLLGQFAAAAAGNWPNRGPIQRIFGKEEREEQVCGRISLLTVKLHSGFSPSTSAFAH